MPFEYRVYGLATKDYTVYRDNKPYCAVQFITSAAPTVAEHRKVLEMLTQFLNSDQFWKTAPK